MAALLLNPKERGVHLIVMTRLSAIFLNSVARPAMVLLSTGTFAAAAPETLPITLEEGKLMGPGAEMIRRELPNAQFILWGEEHGFADSAILLRTLGREARPLGFKYHVVEVGPLSTRMIADKLRSGGLRALHELVREVPLGIPFLCMKDDAELASEYLGRDEKGAPFLWGIDQEFIGSSTFHLRRLVEIAPNESARGAAEKLLAEERGATGEAVHAKLLLARLTEAELDALAAEFKGHAEAQEIVSELKESAAIYQLYGSGHNYENNARRARLLTKNFLAAYKAAADPEPKVVFKMGLEHVALGTTSVNTVDVGTLASSIAKLNGKTALRMAFLPMGGKVLGFGLKPGNPTREDVYESAQLKELFAAIGLDRSALPEKGWALVPLEPVRQSLDNKGINKLKPFSRLVVLGYDYVITTADAKAGVSLY